jgi:predicted metal-dependent hydrolase
MPLTLSSPQAHQLVAEGLGEYQAGRYWHAHERWERVWRELEGAEKLWVQGLILITAAAWHLERAHERVARRLLALAATKLQDCRSLPGLTDAGRLASLANVAAASTELAVPPLALTAE